MYLSCQLWIVVIYSLLEWCDGNARHLWMIFTKDPIGEECFIIDDRYFCRPNIINDSITSCQYGELLTFDQLKKINVSTEDLINWLIPFDLIEHYAVYLMEFGMDTSVNKRTVCNCTENQIGRRCEYSLPSKAPDPSFWLNRLMAFINSDNDETLTRFVDGIICLGADMFLEWRHICDGFTQCQNGADELHCHRLEFFHCEPDEFQCRNGMCIPIEFTFDAMPDCLDWSDEQEIDELYKRYADCSQRSTFDCDDRLCRKDQFSCGNGECVPWSTIFNDQNGCSNARQIAYICEVWGTQQMPGQWFGICKDTIKRVPLSLTNSSDCEATLGHLLQIHHDQQSRTQAIFNLITHCDELIVYSEHNAFFQGLRMLYNRSRIVQFCSNMSNLRKSLPKQPDFYYFIGDIMCDNILFTVSNKIWFDHQELQRLTLYPFFPLSHLICQKIINQSPSDNSRGSQKDFTIVSYFYQCNYTTDRIALRRINDGYIDCLYGDDERNLHYPILQPFRYRCQTVIFPFQYVSYTKLGNGVEDCVDGSDEISNELRWSTLPCNVNDAYACWLFQGDRFQENRLKQARLHFHRYCDSNWDTMNGLDEKNCSNWICDLGLYQCNRTRQCIEPTFICDGEFDCSDGEDETHCPQKLQQWKFEEGCNNSIEYFCITNEYITNRNLNRSCIRWDRVGDGNIDCIGARDERNVASCPDHRMMGDRFLCDNRKKCINYSAICDGIKDCADGTDESICYWNTGWCPAGQFSCADKNGCKSVRCTRQASCQDKSQYFWCPNSTNENNVYRTGKVRSIMNNKKRCYNQLALSNKISEMSSRSDNQIKLVETIRRFYCNRGFYLQLTNSSKLVCFCPPTFYGDRCQFNSRRVGVGVRFDRAYRHDLPIILHVLVTLVSNESVIMDHRYFFDEAKEHPSKYNIYLLYPRPKPPGIYAVRIEVYHALKLIHFWQYSISPLDFLPVFRITKLLRFPTRSLPWFCSHNYCQNNGTCYQNENSQFLCICTKSWKGKLCEMKTGYVNCAPYSLARTESICICPEGYVQPYCYVQNLKCQQHKCESNEICIPHVSPPLHRHICICNTSDCNMNRPVISIHRHETNQLPFLLQLLQLAGDYPNIRQQILIPPFTSFPLIQTIKTRDARFQIGTLPEIGLLFNFESSINSIESSLYLLYINCSDHVRNLSVDLSVLPHKCYALPESERYAVTLFLSFCQNFTYGTCFISDGYLCYCNYPQKNQSNCLSYQQRYTTCSYCQNQGNCIQGDLTNRTDFVCVCPKCVSGVLCQFSSGRFSISLEFLIEKTQWGKKHFIIPIILCMIGLIFNSLAMITFMQQKLHKNGIALQLLITAIFSSSVLILLLIRIIYLYMVRRIIIWNRMNTVMCKFPPTLMYTFYCVSLWLMAIVTVQRALAAIQYHRWSSLQQPKKVVVLILMIAVTVLGSNYILIKQYKLVNHPNDIFPWCIREIPRNEQLLTQSFALIHQTGPFLTNITAAIIIILTIARSKMHVYGKKTHEALADQTRKRIDLLLGPIACFLAQLPEIVFLFLNSCDYEGVSWFSRLTLLSYYFCFAPHVSIFFLYILPSTQYYAVFIKDTSLGVYLSSVIQ